MTLYYRFFGKLLWIPLFGYLINATIFLFTSFGIERKMRAKLSFMYFVSFLVFAMIFLIYAIIMALLEKWFGIDIIPIMEVLNVIIFIIAGIVMGFPLLAFHKKHLLY